MFDQYYNMIYNASSRMGCINYHALPTPRKMHICTYSLNTFILTWSWLILFNEGANILFRVALAIFKINEDQLLTANHVGDIIRILHHTTHHAFDPDALLKVAFEKIGSMTTNSITKHCKKQQAAVMAELEQRSRRLNSLEREQPRPC